MANKISKIIKRINALDSCYVMDFVPCIDYVHEKIREYGLNVFNSGSKITEKLVLTPPLIEMWEYGLMMLCSDVFAVVGYSSGYMDIEAGKYETYYCCYGRGRKPKIAAQFFTVMCRNIIKAQQTYAISLGNIISKDAKNFRLSQYSLGIVSVLKDHAIKLPISDAEQQKIERHYKKYHLVAHLNDWSNFDVSDVTPEQAEADYLAGQAKAKEDCL